GNMRDEVGRARARRGERDADLAGRLGVSLGRVSRALLVAAENVAHAAVVERVVGREVRPARDAEHGVDALGLEALDDGVNGSHCANYSFRLLGWTLAPR